MVTGLALFIVSGWFLPQNNMNPETHPLGVGLAVGALALVSLAGALLLRRDGILERVSDAESREA